MHFKTELLLFLGKQGMLLNDVPRGKSKWSVHPNHKKKPYFPTYHLWFWIICCRDFCCQANTMELNGISFAFGSFHLELFSTRDKNSENWPQFSAPLSMRNLSLKQCLFKSVFIWRVSYVLKHFKLLNTSEQYLLCNIRPRNGVSTQLQRFTLLRLSCLESTCPETGREMWAYAFLNKPETLSPEMELWLCGCTDWVVGGRRTYVYCKLRQILSSPV